MIEHAKLAAITLVAFVATLCSGAEVRSGNACGAPSCVVSQGR